MTWPSHVLVESQELSSHWLASWSQGRVK